MQTITVVCKEHWHDPLIYVVSVNNPQDVDEVRAAVIQARKNDLDDDLHDDIEQNMEVYFAFPGDVPTIADWRE